MQPISAFHFVLDTPLTSDEMKSEAVNILSGEYQCGITLRTLTDIFQETILKEQVFIAQVRSNNFDHWYEGFSCCQWFLHSSQDPYTREAPEFIRLYRYEGWRNSTPEKGGGAIATFCEMSICRDRDGLVGTYDMMMPYAPLAEQIAYINDCFMHLRHQERATALFSALIENVDSLCESFQKGDSSQRETLFLFARVACDKKRPDIASRLLPLLMSGAGTESIAWLMNLGNSFLKTGRAGGNYGEQALELFERVLLHDPHNVVALCRCAAILADGVGGARQDVYQAIHYLECALENGYMLALRRLSYILCRYFEDGHQRALQKAMAALEENPCDDTALSLAINLCRYGCLSPPIKNHCHMEPNIAVAVQCITQALVIDPVHDVALGSLIELCTTGEIGDFQEIALTYFLRAYEEIPTDIFLLKAIARVYRCQKAEEGYETEKNYLLARQFAEKILEIHPQNRDAHFLLAQIYAEGGNGIEVDPKRAIAYLDEILRMDPRDLEPLYLFVKLSREKGGICERHLPRAVLFLRTAAIDATSPANLMLADIYLSGGEGVERNPDEAVRYLRNVALYGRKMRTALMKLRSVYLGDNGREEGSIWRYCEVASALVMRRITDDVKTTMRSLFYWLYFPQEEPMLEGPMELQQGRVEEQ